jgi:hypothetical protein
VVLHVTGIMAKRKRVAVVVVVAKVKTMEEILVVVRNQKEEIKKM